ncbi:hypothetical protein VKT23_001641 [Stygiomarasmius scandens]|uniref:Decapping nuclease n=1 Tax=Marasmiellus scandens TaxID=2682957 RepID=A0ABR1JZI1_9AGAR
MIRHSRQSQRNVASHLRAFSKTQLPVQIQSNSNANADTDSEFLFISHEHAPRLAHVRLGPPSQVACYSRVGLDQFNYNENSSLRRFVQPLSEGKLKPPPVSSKRELAEINRPKRVDQLVQACLGTDRGRKALLQADVVLTRNVLLRMMHGLGKFNVSYADGRLFIEEHEEKLFQANSTGMLAKYGFHSKYSKPYYPKTAHNMPNRLNDWSAVIQRSLGGLNILMSGEVDCVKGKYTANPDCYLELRSRPIGSSSSPYLGKGHWKDLKDWFFRMHLMGTPELFLGLRNPQNNSIVVQTQLLRTEDIPDVVASLEQDVTPSKPLWDPQESVVQAFQTLYMLKDWAQRMTDRLEPIPRARSIHHDLVWRAEMRGRKNQGFFIRELSSKDKERLWYGPETPLWKEGGGPLPAGKNGIVSKPLIRKLTELDLETVIRT